MENFVLGFSGSFRESVTGDYPLGNGYRVYLPHLMRFNSPDDWSPFGAGGINPYTYCDADPINLLDPSGHLPRVLAVMIEDAAADFDRYIEASAQATAAMARETERVDEQLDTPIWETSTDMGPRPTYSRSTPRGESAARAAMTTPVAKHRVFPDGVMGRLYPPAPLSENATFEERSKYVLQSMSYAYHEGDRIDYFSGNASTHREFTEQIESFNHALHSMRKGIKAAETESANKWKQGPYAPVEMKRLLDSFRKIDEEFTRAKLPRYRRELDRLKQKGSWLTDRIFNY